MASSYNRTLGSKSDGLISFGSEWALSLVFQEIFFPLSSFIQFKPTRKEIERELLLWSRGIVERG